MNIENTQSQMRKGILEFCILSIIRRGEVYPSDIVEEMRGANLKDQTLDMSARRLALADPGCIVWDEVVAFWLILWLIGPASWLAQAVAFGLFRVFDAVKVGPVGWADRLFKIERGQPIGWAQGFGILFDDFVAAGCTLLVFAAGRHFLG